ncbi:hypothetical protein [Nitrobacter sp. TKz-YC01]|uniref:hypothetical protein n=1 Tax=Nitrobacter sp. TKz-YC01 TaxID=3398703 RepID=UPI003A0FC0FF
MSILNTLKLASTLIVMTVVGLTAISPAFDFGIFIGGVTLGGYLFLLLETY